MRSPLNFTFPSSITPISILKLHPNPQDSLTAAASAVLQLLKLIRCYFFLVSISPIPSAMLTLLYRHIPSASPLPLFRCNIRHFAPCLAPYRNDMSTTMVNNNLTHSIDFRSTYSGHNDLGIKGLQTTILYESKCLRRCVNISIVMWTQHSIQNLLMLNQFTRSNNIPNEKTMMCACWREPGCTTDFKTSHDF